MGKLEKYLFFVEYLLHKAEAVKGTKLECLLRCLKSYYYLDTSTAGNGGEVDRKKRDTFFLDSYALLSRDKRQLLDLAALGTSVAALSMASYNTYEIKLLEAIVDGNQEELKNLKIATEATLKGTQEMQARANLAFSYLDRVAKFVNSSSMAQHIYNLLDRLDSFVKSASLFALNLEQSLEILIVQERITPFWLDYDSAQKVIQDAKSALQQMGAVLISEDWHKLYKSRAVGVYHQETKQIRIIIGLPIQNRISDLKIYKASNMPIASKHSNISYILDHPNNLFITDGRGHLYREMTHGEFKTCKRFDNAFFCDIPMVFYPQQSTCLSRLFENDLREINRFCRFNVMKQDHLIVRDQTHINKYCLLTGRKLEGQLFCRGQQPQSRAEFLPQKQSLFPSSCIIIPSDCYWKELEQKVFIYASLGVKQELEIPSKAFDLTESRLLAFDPAKFQAQQFHETLQHLEKVKPLHVIDARSYIKALHQHHVLTHQIGSFFANNIGLVALTSMAILAIFALCGIMCCRIKAVKRCFGRQDPGQKLVEKLSPGFSILHKQRKNNPKVLFKKATEKLSEGEIEQIRAFIDTAQKHRDAEFKSNNEEGSSKATPMGTDRISGIDFSNNGQSYGK